MLDAEDDDVELQSLRAPEMEEEEGHESPSSDIGDEELLSEDDPIEGTLKTYDDLLDRRTKRKLDWLLLPFLAILFLLNSLDKSNVGNAETAGFTRDAGLSPDDLNISMAWFFAFFVALQPVGAALGRKVGMVRWVPACMTLWGLCTLLHVWVRQKWQLILLRIAIACLEAGFYPTTVAYLSLFYTRFEFAVRLSLFYGQTAVAGLLGGILSWAVFSRYEDDPTLTATDGLKGWQVLFMIEGCLTMFIAFLGFFWLPRSAETAWFFTREEKKWAEERIIIDHNISNASSDSKPANRSFNQRASVDGAVTSDIPTSLNNEEYDILEAHHRLLSGTGNLQADRPTPSRTAITADAGLTRQDVISAFLNYKIWHILVCNILSAIPVTAFGVFLPLVVKQLTPSLNLAPSFSNLLTAPPFAFGAIILFIFARWSDRSKRRLFPVLCGLGLLIVGLSVTLLVPMGSYVLRYIGLCILLSGAFIASPLTVTWITNNTPEPGKRSILLGINGWGNLGGVFLSVLFTPQDRENGYIRPFVITLLCALASFAGYVALWILLLRENKWRDEIVSNWSEDDKEREDRFGDVPIPPTLSTRLQRTLKLDVLGSKLGLEEGRRGDEKMTFRYGL